MPPRRGVEDEGRGHASRERMQQKLDRVGALVVSEEARRLPVGELERLGPRFVFLADAVEALDPRAILPAPDPLVLRPELESGEGGIRLQRIESGDELLGVEAVQVALISVCMASFLSFGSFLRTQDAGASDE